MTSLDKLLAAMAKMDAETRIHTRVYSTDVQTLMSLMVDVLRSIEIGIKEEK